MRALEFGYMQRALVACVILCAVAPLVGTFVVQRRQSLVGDGMGHVAFAGVGLAFLVGVHPLVGALVLAALAAVALVRLQRSGGLTGDVSLALIFYGGIALGFLFLMRSGIGINRLIGFLFGSPLNLTWAEVGYVAAVCAVVLVVLAVLYRPLVAIAFDEQAARVSGVPVDGLVQVLTLLVALVVVSGMSLVGLLLVAAMMVVPVAAASQVTSSYRGTMAAASLVGAVSAVGGLLGAFYLDVAPGAAIVICAIACYVAAAVATRPRSRAAPVTA
jgi:zinc transport system permease protein